MFRELTLTNFKSFAGEPQTIPFAPVTVFVGANASGKSNVFDAVRFLEGLSLGLTPGDALTGKREGGRLIHPGIRGGFAEARWDSALFFEVGTTIVSHESPDISLRHEIEVSPSGSGFARVMSESLKRIGSEESTLFDAEVSPDGALEVRFADGQGPYLLVNQLSGQTLFGFASDNPFAELNAPEIKVYLRQFVQILARTYFFDFQPGLMREYVDAHHAELGTRGENLSAVAARLPPEQLELVNEWISSVCSPELLRLSFDRTRHGDVILELTEQLDAAHTISAKSVSDGTLRMLALVVALLTVPEGAVVVLEEIENGLHPTRIHLLVELLEQLSAERSLQIVATTHNPQVLLSLSEQALRDVVLFARTEDYPGTVVQRLGDLPHFEEVTQKTRIDELFATGWMEFAL